MSRALLVWGPAALWAGVIFLLSSTSHPPGSDLLFLIPAGDKLGHLLLYGVLGAALARVRRLQPFIPSLALVVLGALYGASDEFHQSFVPGREVSILDWAADLCGVAAGLRQIGRAHV